MYILSMSLNLPKVISITMYLLFILKANIYLN